MAVQQLSTGAQRVEEVSACQRCHKMDRRGLVGWRGLTLCGLCQLIAVARVRLGR